MLHNTRYYWSIVTSFRLCMCTTVQVFSAELLRSFILRGC